ncbi:tRNA pseudouridine(38-40) synthase TruA [Inmirania thermothiophila]|uniref:tRNA pseudouridine synthase A n=1 Tax=Inmirania thermothiophila TaxID=1750597 RepID=A0A3N1Y1Z6_9GAMM|nr:tRNA pseudouridine(38-40) synthase TruA [Inmirania thermothiophila]ROR32836.1 tRNA pseudouridine38-40 synthase [Inmirania thermothiophila]
MRVALGVEYDGSAFRGWQAQDGERTVQAELERALSVVADAPVRVVCAGRTDAGVHATAQVVHFDTEARRSPRSWVLGANVNLPPDVGVRWAREVPEAFHARFSATARRYRYVILNRMDRPALARGRVAWVHRPLDAARMAEAAAHLVGEHDFSAFRAVACQARHPVRELRELTVRRAGDLVILEAEANAFLHHMVRNIAGVLIDIGRGKRPPSWAREVLEGRDRTRGGFTAPPEGLYLVAVRYPAHFGIPEPDLGAGCTVC